jgi:leader peptidase (prepilin peptidase)/N-methyltransferase
MIHIVFLLVLAVCVNATLVAMAAEAANRHDLSVCFLAPAPMCALLMATVCQMIVSANSGDLSAMAMAVAVAAVTVCGITDAQTGYVFDFVTLPSASGILALCAANQTLLPALLGATTAAAALLALYALTLGRGLGLGDIKLAFCIGAGLGVADALASLGISFVLGGVYASYMLFTRRGRRGDIVHFAPYLACGMVLVTLYRVVA